ncbi:hypothetical protein K438DRAFT_1777961 [Mycena galopus ATCC 62051]|nr:hypothetical protein K438DRAFT_1777961 [Mycena galopus ATCC 62051]
MSVRNSRWERYFPLAVLSADADAYLVGREHGDLVDEIENSVRSACPFFPSPDKNAWRSFESDNILSPSTPSEHRQSEGLVRPDTLAVEYTVLALKTNAAGLARAIPIPTSSGHGSRPSESCCWSWSIEIVESGGSGRPIPLPLLYHKPPPPRARGSLSAVSHDSIKRSEHARAQRPRPPLALSRTLPLTVILVFIHKHRCKTRTPADRKALGPLACTSSPHPSVGDINPGRASPPWASHTPPLTAPRPLRAPKPKSTVRSWSRPYSRWSCSPPHSSQAACSHPTPGRVVVMGRCAPHAPTAAARRCPPPTPVPAGPSRASWALALVYARVTMSGVRRERTGGGLRATIREKGRYRHHRRLARVRGRGARYRHADRKAVQHDRSQALAVAHGNADEACFGGDVTMMKVPSAMAASNGGAVDDGRRSRRGALMGGEAEEEVGGEVALERVSVHATGSSVLSQRRGFVGNPAKEPNESRRRKLKENRSPRLVIGFEQKWTSSIFTSRYTPSDALRLIVKDPKPVSCATIFGPPPRGLSPD